MYSLGLLRVVTSCYIFIREKVCETSFYVHFCISFQPTNRKKYLSNQFPGSLLYQFPTAEYLVTYISWACYVLFPVFISLEEKRVVKPVFMFTFVLVSNPRIGEKVCQTIFQFQFFISFHRTATLFHMFIGLVTSFFQLLHLQERNGLSNQFPGSLLYQFPTHDYLVTYVHWPCYVMLPVVTYLEEKRRVKLVSSFTFVLVSNPSNRRKCLSNQFPGSLLYQFPSLEYLVTYISWSCYVLLPVVTSLQKKRFFKPFSRFTFVIVSTPRLPCYICSLGLLLVFSSCYIFRRETVCQTSFQV